MIIRFSTTIGGDGRFNQGTLLTHNLSILATINTTRDPKQEASGD